MKAADYPCWLSKKDLHIAQALIEKAGFIYYGKDEDFIPYDEELGTGYKLAKCCGWQRGIAMKLPGSLLCSQAADFPSSSSRASSRCCRGAIWIAT